MQRLKPWRAPNRIAIRADFDERKLRQHTALRGEQPAQRLQVAANAVACDGAEEVTALERPVHRVDKRSLVQFAMREDISAAVASIDVPTIVISGEQDQVDRIATLQAELMPRIPHAQMHILPGTGHLSPLEAPTEVAWVIARFVAGIEDKPPCAARPTRFRSHSIRR